MSRKRKFWLGTIVAALAACSDLSFHDTVISVRIPRDWQSVALSTEEPYRYRFWKDPEQLQLLVRPRGSSPTNLDEALSGGAQELLRRRDFDCKVSQVMLLPVETPTGSVDAKCVRYTCSKPNETIEGRLFVLEFEQRGRLILAIGAAKEPDGNLDKIGEMIASVRIAP